MPKPPCCRFLLLIVDNFCLTKRFTGVSSFPASPDLSRHGKITDNARMKRASLLPLGFLVLAIIARGLVPWVHGPAGGSDAQNPLLFAFCGSSSPALLAQAAAISPWKSAMPANPGSPRGGNSSNLCPVCVVAASAILIAVLALLLFGGPVVVPARPHYAAAFSSVRLPAYHPRGPPARF